MTAVSRSQVADNERSLAFSVASEFINVELAEINPGTSDQGFEEFSRHGGYWRGTLQSRRRRSSKRDLLKLKLQMLQFQTDVSAAELARVQGLFGSPATARI